MTRRQRPERRDEYSNGYTQRNCTNAGGCRDNCNVSENELIKTIRAIDFALAETILFLDAYPSNKDALEYYHKLREKRGQLVKAYEKCYGPLTAYDNENRNQWTWINSPWPWEAEAN